MTKLFPNDSPILGNTQMDVPYLLSVSQNCSTYLPMQSSQVFEQGDITFLHINARSLHQSHNDIVTLVSKSKHNADFILISETWLHSSLAANYYIDGYEMIHSVPDDCTTGKGCAIYIRKSFFPFTKILDNLCVKQIEYQSIFLLVSVPGKTSFIVATVYRSPSYPVRPFMDYVEDTLDQINLLNKPCFWGGDWNVNLFKYNEDHEPKLLLDCLNSFGFYPTITVPTRIASTQPFNVTLIDNIFTNALHTITSSGSICSGIADHQAVFCSSSLMKKHDLKTGCSGPQQKPKFNYDKIEDLKSNITSSLIEFHNISDPDVAAEKLTSVIASEAAKFTTSYSARRFSPIQPWMTPGLLRSINMRSRLLKEFLKNRSAENQNKFRKYRNTLRLTIRHAKKSYFRAQFEKNRNNSKRLWADLLDALQSKTGHPDLPDKFEVEGRVLDNPNLIADQFNKYYGQVATSLDSSLGPCAKDPMSFMNYVTVSDVMFFRIVTQDEVFHLVSALKDTSSGIDNISVKLVKAIIPCILPHLTHLVNLCLTKNIFPNIFKTAVITPIFKAGSRNQFSNYRPISVLPIFSKILERIMYQQLITFISDNNILYSNQFGFRAKHSTYMPISLLHDFITSNLANGCTSTCIYLDLARAFDTVNIKILLNKLTKYGLSGSSLDLLTSYLSHRNHRLKYKDIISGEQVVTCGVPQGSVLGPLLFLLYINDLPSVCDKAKFLLFADDTAILYSAPNENELQSIVTESFPRVTEWLHANRLSLSTAKTFYQIYSPQLSSKDLAIPANSTYLQRAQTVKYLGVLVDEDMKFKSHIGKVSGIISRYLGIICRAKYLFGKKELLLLYNALILPYLTYCLVIWGSNYESTLQPVIILQKRAIRIIAGAGRISHTSPLFREMKVLKVTDLLRYQLLLILHDFLMGQLPQPMTEKLKLYQPARNTRSNQHFCELVRFGENEILPNYRHVNYLLFTLFCQAPRVWNKTIVPHIPNMQDIPTSKSLFKKCLKFLFVESY